MVLIQSNIKRHLASVHEGKKPFKCDICDYICSQKMDMNRHIASVHEGKKPFKCVICDYSCSQKGNMSTHVASVHEGTKPFKCDICDYICSLKTVMLHQIMKEKSHSNVTLRCWLGENIPVMRKFYHLRSSCLPFSNIHNWLKSILKDYSYT